ncbi:MAG: hypothetical protein ACYDCL_10140 [Myxococcales bacterium]
MAADPRPPIPEPRRVLTIEEGIELLGRFIAGDRSVNEELVLNLNRLLFRVFDQRWSGGLVPFLDLRGDCFVLLARWREEGKLRVEPLPHLAQRLMKQVGERARRGRKRDRKQVSLDHGWDAPGDAKLARFRSRLEQLISARYGPATPELELLAKELYQWVMGARERISPTEQATFDGCLLVADGEAASLGEALGLRHDAADQRRKRLRESIVRLARQDGMDGVIGRWRGGRAPRRDRKAENA